MQKLARDGLSDQQVTALLQAEELSVTAGCDLLNPDLTFREDISDDLEGGQVGRDMDRTIHGVVTLRLARPLVWGVDLVRPHMTLSDGVNSARFNLGVYALTTPERTVAETPETYEVSGFDRIYLLNRQVGRDYTIAAGTTYRQALLDTFAAAGLTGALIEGAAADDTLPTAGVWPLVGQSTDPDQTDTPVTWLRVINDLLRAINFRAVWADENGVFRCESYRDPKVRAVEFTFDADSSLTIVGEFRTIVEDVWATPNRWVFRQTNRPEGAPAPTEGDGVYTVTNQSDGPTSVDARGLVWTSVIDYEAASQAKLVALGDRRVSADRRLTTRIGVTTGPFPAAGHSDVFSYVDSASGGSRKVQANNWQLSLDGADMQWEWTAVQ